MKNNRLFAIALVIFGGLMLSACASNSTNESTKNAVKQKSAKSTAAVTTKNRDFYEVHQHGRIYLFDDSKVYKDFMVLGETPYTLVRIGEGPKGETLVFGLHKNDKKKRSGISSVELYDGKAKPGDFFYAEMFREGRYYVFSNMNDLKVARELGEPVFRYTDIGAGPKGETVVYVLNKKNKKKKPVALLAQFKVLHNQIK